MRYSTDWPTEEEEGQVAHVHCSALVLTINYDLSLLAVRCVHAGDVAAVGASVCDVDTVDGQDASRLCGLRQSFAIGLNAHATVRLVRGNSPKVSFFHLLMPRNMWPTVAVAAAYLFARVRPLNVHSSVELHQRCAVQGEGLPHYQLDWVLRKQLDIVNLTSCPGKRKKGERETEGQREGDSERGHGDIVSSFSFLAGPEEMTFLWTRGAILL